MTVKQISVFVENKPGKLAELAGLLNENRINIRALSVAETEDFGIFRIIVDDPYEAVTVLKGANYVCSVTKVLAVEMSDEPGSFYEILKILGDNGVNLEYTYAFITRKKDVAYMILRVTDNDAAIAVLGRNGLQPICQDELNELFGE